MLNGRTGDVAYICGRPIFNNKVSCSDCTASSDTMIINCSGKGVEGSSHGLIQEGGKHFTIY
jgi:hypothetical protein